MGWAGAGERGVSVFFCIFCTLNMIPSSPFCSTQVVDRMHNCEESLAAGLRRTLTAALEFAGRDSTVKAFASGAVDSGLTPSRVKPMTI